MLVRVCGSHGGESRGAALSSFVVDGTLAIDASSLTRALTIEEQSHIRNVLVTHSHLDHVSDLAFLADNVCGTFEVPVVVWSTAECIEVLREDLFNDRLWPDFTRLPSAERPVVVFRTIEPDVPFEVDGYTCLPVRSQHPVPTTGFIVRKNGATLCLSGDTGRTEHFWKQVNSEPVVSALLTEVSFPNHMQQLADVSGHLTPHRLTGELAKLEDRDYPVYLYHMKPQHMELLEEEVAAEGIENCRMLREGEVLEL